MKKDKSTIIIGIIVLVALFYFIPKLNLFAILPPGECYFNQAGTFLSNVNSPESVEDYKNSNIWVSIDWNSDGQLERYGQSLGFTGQDFCSSKTLIGLTPEGLRIVKWNDAPFHEIAICSPDGKSAAMFRDTFELTDAKTLLSECTNYVIENNTVETEENETACTMEPLQCSDGSYVSRNASNNCAFDDCPSDCTSDKYTACSNGVTYKSANCVNGVLHDIMYYVNPCLTNENNQTQTQNQTQNQTQAQSQEPQTIPVYVWWVGGIVLLMLIAWLFGSK